MQKSSVISLAKLCVVQKYTYQELYPLKRRRLTGVGIPIINLRRSGGRLNKKDGLTKYGDSHVKDKTS